MSLTLEILFFTFMYALNLSNIASFTYRNTLWDIKFTLTRCMNIFISIFRHTSIFAHHFFILTCDFSSIMLYTTIKLFARTFIAPRAYRQFISPWVSLQKPIVRRKHRYTTLFNRIRREILFTSVSQRSEIEVTST